MREEARLLVSLAATAAITVACSSGGTATVTRPGVPVTPRTTAPIIVSTSPSTTLVAETAAPLRALLIGDSTLLAILRYNTFDAFRGFESVFDAQSCRTLGVKSCGVDPVPPNAVEAINARTETFDIVVIMAGYDEWWTSFPDSFDEVVTAARARGARHIVWLTYREGVGYTAPSGATANEAFVKNNETLRAKIASGQFPDVTLADWFTYTASATGWLTDDGIHLTRDGARAAADFISRTIAHLEGRPCPLPWAVGGPIDDPCPDPSAHSPVVDIRALYP